MSARVRVSVFDPATGETETQDLDPCSYILTCGERCELAHTQAYSTGTVVLTIRTNLPATCSICGGRGWLPVPGFDEDTRTECSCQGRDG